MADELENNPEFAKAFSRAFNERGEKRLKRSKSNQEYPSDLDLYQLYTQGGEQLLKESLSCLNTMALKAIIAKNGLDSSQLASKWRNKDRLIGLVIERISQRTKIGDVFRKG